MSQEEELARLQRREAEVYRIWVLKNPDYHKTKSKDRYIRWRIWFVALKKTYSCVDCGNDDYRVLDFHHIDNSTKEYNISQMVTKKMAKKKILKELEKCVALCANCHRIRHNRDINQEAFKV